MKYSLSLLSISLILFFGCQKTEKVTERVLVPERQADPKLSESIQTLKNSQEIQISKDSLGKAFILIPSLIASGKHPSIDYIRPLIISFEKFGSKIAVYNLTEAQLYTTIKSDRLMQTFDVISEDKNSVRIFLDQGFTSLAQKDNLGVLEKDSLKKMTSAIIAGEETSMNVKDSFIRDIKFDQNSIFIEQSTRMTTSSLEDQPDNKSEDQKLKPQIVTKEITGTLTIEIKPYVQNTKFESKTFDKEQNFGFFINFAVLEQKDEPVPQITKWDISDEKGPISIQLTDNVPLEIVSAIEEGALYWNRSFGKEVLKIQKSLNAITDKQKDRTIVIFWIPWDSAGFARANFQADPITGEIFRGQVFMTSSWLVRAQNQLPKKDSASTTFNLTAKCSLEQSKLLPINGLTSDEIFSKQYAEDIIRTVVAHEMGHALGLRHNFAGSSTLKISDEEIINSEKLYMSGPTVTTEAVSTTVMDYTNSVQTAVLGAVIKNKALDYDQTVIGWGYLNQKQTVEKYKYCSDEHIMLAQKNKKSIYGCDRFDSAKNIINSELHNILETERYKVEANFKTILRSLSTSVSYYKKDQTFEQILNSVQLAYVSTYALKKYMQKDLSKEFLSVSSIIDSYLPALDYQSNVDDTSMVNVLKKDALVVGGYAGVLRKILELKEKANGLFYQQQTSVFFQNLDYQKIKNIISADQLQLIHKKFTEQAVVADKDFEFNLLMSWSFADAKSGTSGEYEKINVNFDVGDVQYLFDTHLGLYKSELTKNPKTVVIGESSKQLMLPDSNSHRLAYIRKPYSEEMWNTSLFYTNKNIFAAEKIKLKLAAVANSLVILQLSGVAVPAVPTYENMQAALNQVDWTKVSGLVKSDLMVELYELKIIEDTK